MLTDNSVLVFIHESMFCIGSFNTSFGQHCGIGVTDIVSSANHRGLASYEALGRSFTYRIKNSGPIIDP
jgi:hypothetical protein